MNTFRYLGLRAWSITTAISAPPLRAGGRHAGRQSRCMGGGAALGYPDRGDRLGPAPRARPSTRSPARGNCESADYRSRRRSHDASTRAPSDRDPKCRKARLRRWERCRSLSWCGRAWRATRPRWRHGRMERDREELERLWNEIPLAAEGWHHAAVVARGDACYSQFHWIGGNEMAIALIRHVTGHIRR